MRGHIINILMILVTAAGGVAILLGTGRDPHARELAAAAIAAFAAAELALVPLMITRRASQLAAAQAALVATMVHMMSAATVAAVVVLGKLPLGQPFMYWLMAFYWMTLIGLVATVARHIRRAPLAGPTQPATKA
jgi:hypothetical protein